MTVKRFKEMLDACNDSAEVVIYDADTEDLELVTGCVYDDKRVELVSDTMQL